jgi:signal peptidase I
MGPDVLDRPLGAPKPTVPRRGSSRELFEAACVAVVFALYVRTFLVQAFEVPTPSMEKTVLVGDHVLVNKFVFAQHAGGPLERLLPYRPVRRGDVLVFKYPLSSQRDFIKRAVGLPGDVVAIRNKELFVNGARQSEPRVFHSDGFVRADDPLFSASYRRRDQVPAETVPAGAYFALGDNRDDSNDSRFWGPVPSGNVKGQALFVYWSLTPEGAGAGGPLRRLLKLFNRIRWERTLLPVR